jgi:sugar-specific transcriptional regulator TrmB
MEQPGKPSKYLAVDPGIGLKKLMEDLEERTARQVKQQWEVVESLVSSLSGPYASTCESDTEENIIRVANLCSNYVRKCRLA